MMPIIFRYMNTRQDIEDFLASKSIAVVGLSRDLASFSVMASRHLRTGNYELVGINPAANEIDGIACHASMADLKTKPDGVLFFSQPEVTAQVLEQTVALGINHVWIQQGAENQAVVDYCAAQDLAAVTGRCIMMFAEPVKGFHGFHRWVSKVTGGLPR